jgi:4a-hydroxytetrahydrobiopterin dehydratase
MELISPDDLERALGPLDWDLDDGQLRKVARRRDFADALAYVNAVGALAEAANHHPDIDLRWDTVTLHLMTHSRGGITDADLSLAAKIDALA